VPKQPKYNAQTSYVWIIVVLAAFAVPIVAQWGVISGGFISPFLNLSELPEPAASILTAACSIIPATTFTILVWLLLYPRATGGYIPQSLFVRLAPAVIPPMFFLLVWTLTMFASGFSYLSGYWIVYFIFSVIHIVATVGFSFFIPLSAVVPMQIGQALIALVMIQLLARRAHRLRYRQKGEDDASQPDKPTHASTRDKRAAITGIVSLAICFAALFGLYEHSQRYVDNLNYDQQVGRELSYNYHPFTKDNHLEVLPTPRLTITSNYPRLDGATAALPVYGAMSQAIYRGLDEQSANRYVNCSTTSKAYQQLIDGNIDIFFGAQPSESQQQQARQAGVALELIPLGREAVVFIVNKDNPVDGLTLAQIQDIYQKKITNWAQVGGMPFPIIAYQRNQDSGSQTIMEAKVMGDKQMATPLRYEAIGFMGPAVDRVAEYENGASALGYSFRYYVTGMLQNDNVKLLAIDGIAPSEENIRNGSYPLTIDFYAVTAGTQNPHVPELLDWILSAQGQAAIEQCGYVSLS
jgi:phosphate transport system substrate-binding protein